MCPILRNRIVGLALVLAFEVACGSKSPTSPADILTARHESASFSYRCSPGDLAQVRANVERQEAHFAWATAQLGVVVPAKIIYNKYLSRTQMGDATGKYNTNGFAEPERLIVHTLFPWDNHETVHVYTSLIGRPSDFFNEGIAVAFQTDPAAGDFESRFNGQQVHEAAADYRRQGLLRPLDGIVETSGFRSIGDSTLSYREAGSFVRFLIDSHGFDPLKNFFRISGVNDTRAVIRQRFQSAYARSLDDAEAAWLASLPAR